MRRGLLFVNVALCALMACSGGGASAGGSLSSPNPTSASSQTQNPTPSASPTPVYTPAATYVPTKGATIAIGKCINMGNHLEGPTETAWGRAIVDADFTIIKQAGFETIRLPVRWSAHALMDAPYTIDATWMARVRHVVDTAKAAGLKVMLNVHHYDEIFIEPAAHAARFAALWEQVAAEFAPDDEATLWFELLNEPHNALNDSNLLSVLNPALANVRATNPTRPVIIGGQNWSSVDSLATLPLPDDDHLVVTIHSYDPFNFTHQGATWQTPTPPLGATFGSAADYAYLDANLEKVKAYRERTGRQVFLGEYGVNDVAGIPLSERVKYYGVMTAAYASIGVESCAWGYTNTFRLRDGNAWLPGMVEAIRAPIATP